MKQGFERAAVCVCVGGGVILQQWQLRWIALTPATPLPAVTSNNRYECLAMLQHANHLEAEYGAGPHTISVPRLRPADGSELSIAPPHAVDDANFKKLVAILRISVPYTGMILSTRESPAMRDELLKVGMSQMSAGSRTDVGAYHRDDTPATENALGDLTGQFSLMDHRWAPGAEGLKGAAPIICRHAQALAHVVFCMLFYLRCALTAGCAPSPTHPCPALLPSSLPCQGLPLRW